MSRSPRGGRHGGSGRDGNCSTTSEVVSSPTSGAIDMAKVLIDATTLLPNGVDLGTANSARWHGAVLPNSFLGFFNWHPRCASPMLISDFVVIGDAPGRASNLVIIRDAKSETCPTRISHLTCCASPLWVSHVV
jgi:hypothetical protein